MKLLALVFALAALAGCSTTSSIGDGRLIGVKTEGKTYSCEIDIDGNIDLAVCRGK